MRTFVGTPGYLAPELVEGQAYQGTQVDMFALGVVLFTMVTQRFPFTGVANMQGRSSFLEVDQLFAEFCTNKQKYYQRFEGSGVMSDELKDLLNSMMHYDASMRPSPPDIIVHPWLQSDLASPREVADEFIARKNAKVVRTMNPKPIGSR